MAVDLKGAILEVHRQKWRTAIDVTTQDFGRKHFDIEPNRARPRRHCLVFFRCRYSSGYSIPDEPVSVI